MSSTPASISGPEPRAVETNPGLEHRLSRLRVWNIAVGVVLALEAVAMAFLTNGFSLPVTSTYMSGPPGTPSKLTHLFDVPLGWGVFAFMALSAVALLAHRVAGHLRLVQAQPAAEPELRPVDRVLRHGIAHDRAHHHDLRHQSTWPR